MKAHGPQDDIPPLKDEGFTSPEGFLGREGRVGMTSVSCVHHRALGAASGRAGPSFAVCARPSEPLPLIMALSVTPRVLSHFSGQHGPVPAGEAGG